MVLANQSTGRLITRAVTSFLHRVCARNFSLNSAWEASRRAGPVGWRQRHCGCNTCRVSTRPGFVTRSLHTTARVARGRVTAEYGTETSGVGWHSAAGLFSAVSRQSITGTDGPESGRLITSHKAEVNGVQLNYDQVGTGKNVVLLLPGALGSSKTDFQPQLDGINKDMFTLIAFDPRGYGQSRPPTRDWPEHFFERDAEDAAKLMQNLGGKQYSLLGWSDGGITALMVAARYPNLVKKLVVWGSNAYVTPEEIEIYESIRDLDKWSARMKDPMIKMYGEEYFKTHWNLWIDAFTRYLKERNGNICKNELKNIECPTLILHGGKDPLVPDFHPEFLNQNIQNSRVHMFPEGRHNIHLKLHNHFNSIVENFLLES